MGKTMKMALCAMLAVMLCASMGMASEVDVNDNDAPVAATGGGAAPVLDADDSTVGADTQAVQAEALFFSASNAIEIDFDAATGWPAAGAARSIGYYSDVALNTSSTVTFTFTNGALKADPTMFLLAYDNAGPGEVVVGTLNDFGTNADGNYTWVRFQIDTSGLAGTETLTLNDDTASAAVPTGDPIPANSVLWISHEDAATGFDAPMIMADAGLNSGNSVTCEVTDARDAASNPLSAPLADAEDVVDVVSGISAKIQHVNDGGTALEDGAATSVIDAINSSLLAFVNENTDGNEVGGLVVGNGDTDPGSSEAAVVVANTAEFAPALDDGTDTWTISLQPAVSNPAVDSVTISGQAATESSGVWSASSDFAAQDLTTTAAGATVGQLLITVDETTVLNRTNWFITLTVDPDQTDGEVVDISSQTLFNGITEGSSARSHIWSINGFQGTIQNAINQLGIVWIANNSDQDAGMSVTLDHATLSAEADASSSLTGSSITTAYTVQDNTSGTDAVIVIPANSSKFFYMGQLFEAVNDANGSPLDLSNNKYYGHMVITVNTDPAQVDMWGLQNVGNAWQPMNVYDDNNNN